MITEEVMLNGKKIKLIKSLPEDEMHDEILIINNKNIDKTLEIQEENKIEGISKNE